jgi:hypothetical protein
MRIVGICGEPATGKTTLANNIMSFDTYGIKQHGVLRYMEPINGLGPIVLGIYEGDTFDGTDKLSMAVIDDAENFMYALIQGNPDACVLFEGDRLWCPRWAKFLTCELRHVNARFYRLYINTPELIKRHTHRAVETGKQQDPKFIMSRKTKYDNLNQQFPGMFQRRANNTKEDGELVAKEIMQFFQTGV